LIGSKRLTLTWQTEIGDLNIGSSTLLDLPYLAPQEVQRSSGQIVISKAENLDVVPTDKRENLRPIDPEHDLAGGRKIENASQAYEFHQDWSLQTKITRYDLQEIKPTAIERSVYRIRLDQNNNISVQAVLLVRSVNQRIGLAFPSGADMTSEPLKINGVETSLEYEGEADKDKQYYIPLRNASSDLPVLLEVNYRIKKSGGKIPVLAFDEETAVHDCYLFLQIPENWELIGYRGDWDDYLPGSWIDSLVGGAIALGMGDRTPQPESQQIIQDMQQRAGGGMVVQNPLIGNPIPFTSLDPQEPLTVTTLSARSLHLSVFALLGIFAIAGIRQKLANQFVMLIVLMALSIGIGIVLPLLSDKAFGAEAALTIVGIAVTWMILDLVQVMRDKPFPIFRKLFSKMETPPNAPNDSAPPGDKEPGEHQATETEEEEAIKLEPTEGDTAAEKLENTNTDVAENSDTADADAAPPPSDDSSSDDESNEEGSA